jgi:hypothetical protein
MNPGSATRFPVSLIAIRLTRANNSITWFESPDPLLPQAFRVPWPSPCDTRFCERQIEAVFFLGAITLTHREIVTHTASQPMFAAADIMTFPLLFISFLLHPFSFLFVPETRHGCSVRVSVFSTLALVIPVLSFTHQHRPRCYHGLPGEQPGSVFDSTGCEIYRCRRLQPNVSLAPTSP